MAASICVGTWNDREGLHVHAEYPSNFRRDNNIEDAKLVAIFNDRIVHDTPGFDVIDDDARQIATYYTPLMKEEYEVEEDARIEHGIVFLFLDLEKKIESIKEQFIEFSIFILKLINNEDFPELFFNIIDNFSFLEPISDEQRVASLYDNEVREHILSKLAERACSRNELENWLRDEYNIAAIDLQGLLAPFFKTGIAKQSYESVKGKRKELYYFLIKDVYLFRIPPKKIVDAFKRGKVQELDGTETGYYDEVKEFFEDYELTTTEINKLGVLLAIPNIYKIVTLLREEVYEMDEFRIDFMEKFNYMPSNFNYLLKLLEKNNIIKIYKKGAKKILALKSDIQYQFFFPEYLVDNIRKAWRDDLIDKNIALKHLTMLRDEYLENFMKVANPKERASMILGATLDEYDGNGPAQNRINVLRKMELLLKM
ncbi:MAG TPA: hypothetical protein VKM55_18430 [Candidatus Lokiarchaeia archaeon]|nr:hypothetical protein [Candidatus Lokiarchaeia archaeon]